MAIAILLGVLVLVGAGLVIAVRTAQAARRDLENLEGEFADSRGGLKLDSDSDPAPWSSIDLEILRDDVIVVEGADPFDTLTDVISPAGWHESQESDGLEQAAANWLASHEADGSEQTVASWLASQESNGSEHTADHWFASQESNGSEHTSSTDLAPVDDMAPVTWRAPADAPVIILVAGVGFLGTGMKAGVTTAARLRRAWDRVENSFDQARVITLDPEARHAPSSAFDPGGARDGIVVDEEHDPFPTQENGDSQVRWPPPRPSRLGPSNGGPRPNGEPKPIEWRAPGDYAARR
jgi:hypothetical protein